MWDIVWAILIGLTIWIVVSFIFGGAVAYLLSRLK